jgi:hypothetical protein
VCQTNVKGLLTFSRLDKALRIEFHGDSREQETSVGSLTSDGESLSWSCCNG